MQMQTQIIVYLAVIVLIGIMYCFFGSRYFRAIFTATAFIAGMALAYVFAGVYFSMVFAKIAVAVTGGILLSLIFNLLPVVGRFLIGFLSGIVIGMLVVSIFSLSKSVYFWDAVFLLSMVLGVFGIMNKKIMLRISSALTGAFAIAISIAYIGFRGIAVTDFNNFQSVKDAFTITLMQYHYYVLGITAVLTAGGIFTQFLLCLRQTTGKDAKNYAPALRLTEDIAQDDDFDPEEKRSAAKHSGKHVKTEDMLSLPPDNSKDANTQL